MSEDTTIDDLARSDGIPLGAGLQPSMFAGVGTGAVKGVARGVIGKPALLAGDAVTPMLRPTAKAIDALFGTSVDSWLTSEREKNRAALDTWRPDPVTTGFAGQVVHGLFDLGGSAIVFGPASTGIMEGYAQRENRLAQGVDPLTATEAGAVSGAAAYGGLKIPLTLGKAAAGKGALTMTGNMAFGGASAGAAGFVEQNTLKEILSRNGYQRQADAIDPFDRTSLAAQTALGALFSGAASAVHARSTPQGQAAIDAALAINRARHAAIDTAPGIPATEQARAAHTKAMDAAGAAVLRNEPVNVGDLLAGAEFVRPESAVAGEAAAEVKLHLADVVMALESNGRRYGKDGALLTSPKGARGEMQVMPGTARDPGFGVAPARDGSADELARVGRDYLGAMEKRYGAPDAALAAYNAGPGAVDKARSQHGANWLEHMPQETQAYVARGMRELGTKPHGAPEAPTQENVLRQGENIARDAVTVDSAPDGARGPGPAAETGNALEASRAAREPVPPGTPQDTRAWAGEVQRMLDEHKSPEAVVEWARANGHELAPETHNALIALHEFGPGRMQEMVGRFTDMQLQRPGAKAHDLIADMHDQMRGESGPAGRTAPDPMSATREAAQQVATSRPDMLVTMEDGTRVRAGEVMQQAHAARQAAKRESTAFQAAVNCLLRAGV